MPLHKLKVIYLMRVISGTAKGRQLKSVSSSNTRPTTDKVKEALFNIITPYLNGGVVLDLFAGTGGLGIEALSRGMEHGIFVDQSKYSIDVINENIDACGFNNITEVYRNDADRALKVLTKRNISFDLVFLDPPYKMGRLEELITFFAEHDLLNQGGIIVAEHDSKVILPEKISTYQRIKQNIYGTIGLSIYKY